MPFYIVLFLAGLVLGTVVNWLADQLPLLHVETETEPSDGDEEPSQKHIHLESLRRPVCTHCGAPRPMSAWNGLTAWLTGNRTCSGCGSHLSIRYPVVEVVLGLIYALLYGSYGLTPQLGIYMVYMTLFMLIAVIDIEHRYILNVIIIPAFIFALIELALSGRVRLLNAFAGYAVGQLVLMVIYLFGVLYLWNVNRDRDPDNKISEIAFGFGDVTLGTFCGLVLGFPNVFYMLVLMVIIGGAIALLYGIYYLVVARRYGGYVPIAYGPAILLATTIMLLTPDTITNMIYHSR